MEIRDLLKRELMITDLQSVTKEDVIDEMIERLSNKNIINDFTTFKREILKRESESSTGLGDGVAMPHAKTIAVNTPAVLFARSTKGVDYEALDGEPSYIFFMIAAGEGENNLHIETLAAISKLLLHDGFIEKLKECESPDDVYQAIDGEMVDENVEREIYKTEDTRSLILAVTACPTGIAHTYMAEEALLEEAKRKDVEMRVETNGSDGIKNAITKDEINRAIGVIIAADKKVELVRFDGKHMLQVPVADGIRKASSLIDKITVGDAPVYHANENDFDDENENKKTVLSKVYKDLMNGVSYMLPFVVGGGILLALSFLVERFFPGSPIFRFLNSVGGNAFSFLIPILAGYIAMSIGDRPALMPGMVAGFIAANGINGQAGSGFIGGLMGGFLAGYIVVWLKSITLNIPKSLEGTKPMLIFPVCGLLITGASMYFIIGPLFSFINVALNNFLEGLGTANAIFLGTLLAAMMSVDMGGPVNKAAYTFSIGVFTGTKDGAFMAAVMAGGMVAPLAVGLASTIWKKKFTEKERQSGLTNYILGLSFITEGAIPFAATDGLKLIIPSVLGSAIAGGLTQVFHVKAPAPHGGIFVVPAMANLSMGLSFVFSVLVGATVAGILYGILRKAGNKK